MTNNGTLTAFTEKEQMGALIEKLSAYVEQYHGGSVEMVDFNGRVLEVRLGGACDGLCVIDGYTAWLGRRDCTPVLPAGRAGRSCSLYTFFDDKRAARPFLI